MTKLGNDFMNTVVFNKIYENGQLDFSNSSGGARTTSISSVLSTIYHHPITLIGVGYDELRDMGGGRMCRFSISTSRYRNNIIFYFIRILFLSGI